MKIQGKIAKNVLDNRILSFQSPRILEEQPDINPVSFANYISNGG